MTVSDAIVDIVKRLHAESDLPAPDVGPGYRLWEDGLDSLDIAVLVIELADLTGVDPLADGAEFHTVAELAALYP